MKKRIVSNLMPGEKIVKSARFSFAILIPSLLFLLIFISVMSDPAVKESGNSNPVIGMVAMIIISALPAIKVFLSNALVVTNRKIYGRTGLIKKQELVSPLRQVQNVKVDRSFFGRFLRYGTIAITTTSGIYSFRFVSAPEKFRNALMAQIENTEFEKMDVHAEKIADAIYNRNNKK